MWGLFLCSLLFPKGFGILGACVWSPGLDCCGHYFHQMWTGQAYNGDSCDFFFFPHMPRITGTQAFTYHVAAGSVMDSFPLMHLARSPQAVRVRALSSYPFWYCTDRSGCPPVDLRTLTREQWLIHSPVFLWNSVMNSLNHQLVVTGSHSDPDAIAMETIPLLRALSVSAVEHSGSIITVIPK